MNTFGTRLKELREEKGYTQKAVADCIGISRNMMWYYESDRIKFPNRDTVDQLALLLDTTSDYLLNGKPEPVEIKKAIPAGGSIAAKKPPKFITASEYMKIIEEKKDAPQVTMAWADELPPKKEAPVKVYTAPKTDFVQPVPAKGSDQITSQSRPVYKDKPLVYKAEDGRKLDDINLIIRHIRDMHISTDEKRRLHNRLSTWRTEIEAVVLFGE